jgi:CheY-like chemotaxis protein
VTAGATILAVEDEPLNRRLLHAILEPAGYRVVDAATLAEARDWLADNLPDLVLLDLRLPDGNGLELAREMKGDERSRAVPIVAATASAMPPVQLDADEAGCDGFLAKPIAPSALRAEVERQLRRARSTLP